MAVSTERPEVLIDTAIADKYEEVLSCEHEIQAAFLAAHTFGGDRRVATGRTTMKWTLTDEQALEATPSAYYAEKHRQAVIAVGLHRGRRIELLLQLEELEKQYTGWSRFFLVISSDGGHLHSHRGCGTCHRTTLFGWLPQLSGLTEADAVADQGPRLCSVCFPSAPLEWTLGLKRDYCTGSDKPVGGEGRRPKYVRCPDCGKTVSTTTYRQIRKHQPETAKGGN